MLAEITKKQEDYLADYNISAADWRVLKTSIFPGADEKSIIMALSYCKARKLDIFKKPVHLVPMLQNINGNYVYVTQVMPGISEIRTTASRTGRYAGMDLELGPTITCKYTDNEGNAIEVPEWCKATVYAIIDNNRCAFSVPVYFHEACATKGKGKEKKLNSMWSTRPIGQIQKCAEAASLRAAFPEELGGIHAAEEMEHKELVSYQPSYDEDTATQFTELFQKKDAIGLHCYIKTMDIQAQIDLYNTFPQGKKTEYKKIYNDLVAKGAQEFEALVNYLDELAEEHNDESFCEAYDECQEFVQDQIKKECSEASMFVINDRMKSLSGDNDE